LNIDEEMTVFHQKMKFIRHSERFFISILDDSVHHSTDVIQNACDSGSIFDSMNETEHRTKAVTCPQLHFIHRQTPGGRGIGPFTPALFNL